MTMTFNFQKAVKSQERLRLALDGPAGSGKTWTSLLVATYLVEKEGGRIAVIDSERGSARKYASDFDFDHLSLPDDSPHTYIAAIRAAEQAGYVVVIVDSLSHAWEGTLELKDDVTARSKSKNSFDAWREVTPVHNDLVDAMLRLPAHIIVTMRTKTAYTIEEYTDDQGRTKSKPVKLGMKPIQRDGVEYEFDVVGDLDVENTLAISKTRCRVLGGAVIRKPDDRFAKTLFDWLNDGEPLASRAEIEAIRARVKAIPEKDQRNECARLFKDRFGPVEALTLSTLPAASLFVAEYEASTPPAAPPGGGHGASPVETTATAAIGNGSTEAAAGDTETSPAPSPESAVSATSNGKEDHAPGTAEEVGPDDHAASGAGSATVPPADRLISEKQAQGVHIDAATAAKTLGHVNGNGNGDPKWSEPVLDALILNVTGGRTSSSKELTAAEHGRLFGWLDDVVEGRVTAKVGSLGGVELSTNTETLRFVRTEQGQLQLAQSERTSA